MPGFAWRVTEEPPGGHGIGTVHKPLLALPLLVVLLLACGGRTVDPGTDGGSSALGDPATTSEGEADAAGSASSTTASGDFPICPPQAPTAGEACLTPNQGCAYFTEGPCVSFTCNSSSVWIVSTPAGC